MARSTQTVVVQGRRLRVSSLDKVLYPATGTTKRDVMSYYEQVAPVMVPYCRDRAATRKRWPNGVGSDGHGPMFFHKDAGRGVPEWVQLRSIHHRGHVNRYPLVNDAATLMWLAQLAALEIHVPQWRFAATGEARNPDRLVLDLDPGPGTGLAECAEVATLAREILTGMGLDPIPVTSGSKGIHLYAALDGTQTSEQVSAVAHELARALEADHPDRIISSMTRTARAGKVFIDWSQNSASKTTIAPYSLRGRIRPTVALPRTWTELAAGDLRQLELADVLTRVEQGIDPLTPLRTEPAAETTPARDKLTVYRSKRDARRTPEPVPDRVEDGDGSPPVFVIHKHAARRLHYDLRIEHEGVLVSWALPKGVPTDPKRNHLAVPTEDHPLQYRFFEGTIPAGEYGAGEVEIWDAGRVEIGKWREDEVIATLDGRDGGGLGGRKRFALFRTSSDPDRPQWMIHLMSEPAARTAPAAAPMLATRSSPTRLRGLDPTEWAFEMKWDGMRAVVEVSDGTVRVSSRSGADITATFPELAEVARMVAADSAIFDGEIVALTAAGTPSFSRLQQRSTLSNGGEISRVRTSVPVALMVFDLLELNGHSCRSLTYTQRRELLGEALDAPERGPVAIPPEIEGDGATAIAASRELGLEGVIAKRRESTYRDGHRSSDWLKVPHATTAEVAVIGWRASAADAAGFASLLLAVRGPEGLEYAGRVGTGFSASERRSIRRRLERIERTTPAVPVPEADRGDARWVTVRNVGEVEFRERTAQGKLRHPTWRGWRPDKTVGQMSPPTG